MDAPAPGSKSLAPLPPRARDGEALPSPPMSDADVPDRPHADLRRLVAQCLPGATLLDARPFHVDDADVRDAATTKGEGYGEPLRVRVREADGRESTLVFHTAKPDVFGHDRRADRAAEMLLAWDTFGAIPRHVAALDVGAVTRGGASLVSLRDAGEFYLVTRYAEGRLYADELRRVARDAAATEDDLRHAESLARYLAALHAERLDGPARYVRAVRDLVGSGEGIFGIIDGYPADVPMAPPARLEALERAAVAWRWRLKPRAHRLRRTHGDFHPFNVVIDAAGEPALLDASRGCAGDPADDVCCMAINYVFFAVEHPAAWRAAMGPLWRRFWGAYLAAAGDDGLLDVAAPFLAWRGLVVCNPAWYPNVSPEARDRVLSFVERTLAAERFDPASAEALFP